MSNVLLFRRLGGQFLLLYSAALFPASWGFPAPFWIEEWDGRENSESKVIWRSASYQAMRRDALDIMRSGDRLVDVVAHPELLDTADFPVTLFARSTAGAPR